MSKIFLSLLPVALSIAADSNWPQFRGTGASGVGAGSPPIEWNGESGKNILWKADIPGLGLPAALALGALDQADVAVGGDDLDPALDDPAVVFRPVLRDLGDRGGTVAAMAEAEGLPFRALITAPDLGFDYEGA